jgi:hypothetical protein
VQLGTLKYADGTLLDFSLTNLYTPPSEAWNVFYTSEGYMTAAGGWKFLRGNFRSRGGPEVSAAGIDERANLASFPRAEYVPGPDATPEATVSHFRNFVDGVRSRRVEDLYCDVIHGHMSATLCHLGNISYRLGRKLRFDPEKERFVGDAEADRLLTREYREPYVLPARV